MVRRKIQTPGIPPRWPYSGKKSLINYETAVSEGARRAFGPCRSTDAAPASPLAARCQPTWGGSQAKGAWQGGAKGGVQGSASRLILSDATARSKGAIPERRQGHRVIKGDTPLDVWLFSNDIGGAIGLLQCGKGKENGPYNSLLHSCTTSRKGGSGAGTQSAKYGCPYLARQRRCVPHKWLCPNVTTLPDECPLVGFAQEREIRDVFNNTRCQGYRWGPKSHVGSDVCAWLDQVMRAPSSPDSVKHLAHV
jgi:hypothetical protein